MKEKLSKQSIDTWAAGLKFYTSASSKIESDLTKMKAISLTWYDVLYSVYTKPKNDLECLISLKKLFSVKAH